MLSSGQNLKTLIQGGPADAYEPQEKLFPHSGFKLGDIVEIGATGAIGIGLFRVLKNSGTKLTPYRLQESVSTFIGRTAAAGAASASALNTRQITFDAGTEVLEDALVGGMINTLQGTVVLPEAYRIWKNSASTGTHHKVTVYLSEGLRRAVSSSTIIQVVTSPFVTQQGTDSANDAAGWNLVEVPPNYYYLGVVEGYIPTFYAADQAAAAVDDKSIAKGAGGTVEVNDNVGRRSLGHLVGAQTIANTTFVRCALSYVNLLG